MFKDKKVIIDGYEAVFKLDSKLLPLGAMGTTKIEGIRYILLFSVDIKGEWYNNMSFVDKKCDIEEEDINLMVRECVYKFRCDLEVFKDTKKTEFYWNGLNLETLL